MLDVAMFQHIIGNSFVKRKLHTCRCTLLIKPNTHVRFFMNACFKALISVCGFVCCFRCFSCFPCYCGFFFRESDILFL
jgi:hypothetical protein